MSTATRAHKMLDKPAFTDPKVLDQVNNLGNPSYLMRKFPGKGRGLVANKTIHRGDQILASTPLLLSDPDAYNLVEEERFALLRRGVDQLPPDSRSLFWSQMGHFNDGDPIDDRINTNAFDIEIDGNSQYASLPEIAWMNHDCRPNAAYFFDEETLSHYVHATQSIYPGEEITVTYISNDVSRRKRMDMLYVNWGFKCSCSSCSAHPTLTAQSDARVKQIDKLSATLDDWTSDSDVTTEMAETLISLHEQERLIGNLGKAYKQAAETYASFGNKWNAVKYAQLSAEFLVLDKGFRDPEVKDMTAMAREPEVAWSWKKRVGMQESGCGCGCGRA